MIASESTIGEQLDRVFDVCVIGAGAAGLTVARELDGSALTVAVLEAGGLERSEASQEYFKGQEDTERMPRRYLSDQRLRLFGGTTGHWAGEGRPLDDSDFEPREWIPDSGWPIRRRDLEDFYRRAAPYCAFEAMPVDSFATEAQTRSGREGLFDFKPLYRAASPPRFGTLHRAALAASKNVIVLLSCPVIEIHSDPDGWTRISSVVVAPPARPRHVLRARRFVLAAGTVESARLVLASMRTGALRTPGEDVVGRYFMDHGEGEIAIMSARSLSSAPIGRLISEAKPYSVQGFLSAIGISAATQRKWQLPNVGFEIAMVSPQAVQEEAEFAALAETDRLQAFFSEFRSAQPVTFRLTFRSETRPTASNRVSLTDENDPLGVPRVKLHYRWSAEDMRGVDVSLRLLAQDWSGPHHVLIRQLNQANQCVGSSFHQMGTTRMGDDPRSSWVDGNCKVHSVPNLYVAGSSVFPTVGWANPTLTIVALAIRLAQRLKDTESVAE